jgi:16S rRNA (uracil1498-N3)-methyltransferase
MRLHRFYIEQKLEKGKEARIENPELIHQWTKVFRFGGSDRVVLFNGDGSDFEGYFRTLNKDEAIIFLDKERKIKNKPAIELHIFPSIIKGDNFELIVQKCAELGAAAIHPIIAKRSEKKGVNLERLKKIAVEAAEQSGRGTIPEIFEPQEVKAAVESFTGKLFTLDFDGEPFKLVQATKGKIIGICVGPEGGWTDDERDIFDHFNAQSVSLGEQILRAETAAIAASALLLLK